MMQEFLDEEPMPAKDQLKAPVLTEREAARAVEMLAMGWSGFPKDPIIRRMIGEELRCLCRHWQDAQWLVSRMIALYPNAWPGPAQLRRVYCERKIPHDGIPFARNGQQAGSEAAPLTREASDAANHAGIGTEASSGRIR